MRNFNEWLDTMTDTVADWKYYTDFEKVYKNVDSLKIELSLLNSLIGSKDIEEDFRKLVNKYPEVLKAIPILIAKRIRSGKDRYISIRSAQGNFDFDFKKMNYQLEDYVLFMEKTGIFDLFTEHLISNVYDYVTGIEVGLDSNGRKNRTGHAMENIVQGFLEEAGYKLGINLFKEMYQDQVEEKFDVDLSKITNEGNTKKRFDFVIQNNYGHIYLIEVNFYSSGGSKLNEVARSYKMITEEAKEIDGVSFMWITDGMGWKRAKNNLHETFEVLNRLYNINDMSNGIFMQLNDK